jgi:hypothetical protein
MALTTCSRAGYSGCMIEIRKPSSSLNGLTTCAISRRERASKQGSNGSPLETPEMSRQLAKVSRSCESTTVRVTGCISRSKGES